MEQDEQPQMAAGEALRFAPVLERMVELLVNTPGPVTFGGALRDAAAELGIPVESGSAVESALLRAAFGIVSTRRLPGYPDAG